MRVLVIVIGICLCVSTSTGRGAAACAGDCNGDGEVTIDEIIKGVAVALGANLDLCPSLDTSGDGQITVDELIRAVTQALNGCPPADTPTATPTSVPTPTSTPTVVATVAAPSVTPTSAAPSTVAQRAAGLIDTLAPLLRTVPTLVSALLGQSPSSGLLSVDAEVDRTFQCPSGGGGTLSCSRSVMGIPPDFGPPIFTIVFDQCLAASQSGGNLKLNGTITAQGQNGDGCLTLPDVVTLGIDQLTLDATGARGGIHAQFSQFSAVTTSSCSQAQCTCKADSIGLELTGNLALSGTVGDQEIPGVNAVFSDGSSILLDVLQYDAACTATVYNMCVNGDIDVATQGVSFVATFGDTTLSDDSTSGQDRVSIEGSVQSDCLGSSVAFHTQVPLAYQDAAACPLTGQLLVDHDNVTDLLNYADANLAIDLNDDQSVDAMFQSCFDQALFVCVASN